MSRRAISNIVNRWSMDHGRKFGWEGNERIDAIVDLFNRFVSEGYEATNVKMNSTKKLVIEEMTAPSRGGPKKTANWKKMVEKDYAKAYDLVFDPREDDDGIVKEFDTPVDDIQETSDFIENIAPKKTSDIPNKTADDISKPDDVEPVIPEWLRKIQEKGPASNDVQSDEDFMEDLGLK